MSILAVESEMKETGTVYAGKATRDKQSLKNIFIEKTEKLCTVPL